MNRWIVPTAVVVLAGAAACTPTSPPQQLACPAGYEQRAVMVTDATGQRLAGLACVVPPPPPPTPTPSQQPTSPPTSGPPWPPPTAPPPSGVPWN